jgi:hypothetical protein
MAASAFRKARKSAAFGKWHVSCWTSGNTPFSTKGSTMRRIEIIAGSLLWLAAAALMPLAALEPVQAAHAATAAGAAAVR